MNDHDFMRPLFWVYVALAVACLLVGGLTGLLATNESWATAGAGFCVFGTPAGLLFAGLVWLTDRWMG